MNVVTTGDRHADCPYQVEITGVSSTGDEYTVIYRQAASPRLYGTRGSAGTLLAIFGGSTTSRRLANVLLQSMSEPNGPGIAGLAWWAKGLVDNPADIGWFPS